MFKKSLFGPLAVTVIAIAFASCGGSATKSSSDGGRQERKQADAQAKAAAKAEAKMAKRKGPTLDDLMDKRVKLMGLSIPIGLGNQEAATEEEARDAAMKEAREKLTGDVALQAFRTSDTYGPARLTQPAQRTAWNNAKKAWNDKVAQLAEPYVRAAPAYKTAVEYSAESQMYRVYALVILDPVLLKQVMAEATESNAEFKRRAQNDWIMKKADAIIADFDSKYRMDGESK